MKEIITFFLDGKRYGIEISGMQSLESCQEIQPLEEAPEGILGTVEVREEIFPVLDIRARLALPPGRAPEGEEEIRKKILLLRTGAGVIACMIDGMGKVFRAEGDDVQTFPSIAKTKETEFVDFIVRVERELVVVIRPDALLTKEQAEGLRKIDFSKIKEEE